ncbi:hypothetical protein FQZ97_654320 [compost metagenome]
MNELPSHRYRTAAHLRRHRRQRRLHPRSGSGQPYPVGREHADEAAGGGCAATHGVRARRPPGQAHRRGPDPAGLCAAHPQAARRSDEHPAPAAHGGLGAHRHAGRLRDALPARHPLALRPGLPTGAGGSALRLFRPAAAAPGPRPDHRHPQAGRRHRRVPAPGTLRLGRGHRLQSP